MPLILRKADADKAQPRRIMVYHNTSEKQMEYLATVFIDGEVVWAPGGAVVNTDILLQVLAIQQHFQLFFNNIPTL